MTSRNLLQNGFRSVLILGLIAAGGILSSCRHEPGVGHGGEQGRDCHQERYCDRYGCVDRTICTGPYANNDQRADQQAKNDQAWMKQYGMSAASLKTLDQAFVTCKEGSYEGLENLGLTEKDANRIVRFQMPTNEGITNLSANLKITPQQGQKMVAFLIQTASAQAKDVNSNLWQVCMANGYWQTPENNNCQKTYWNGCSPETGATMCIPAE